MTARSKTTLKTYFNFKDRPSEAQFADLIDSFLDATGDMADALTSATNPSASNSYITELIATTNIPYSISANSATFDSVVDDGLAIGYNLTPGTAATKIDADEPIIKWDLEANYRTGGQNYSEANINYIGIDGTARRPLAVLVNRTTHDVTFKIQSGAGGVSLFCDNGWVTVGANNTPEFPLDFLASLSGSGYLYGAYFRPTIESTTQHVYGFQNSPNVLPADTKWGIGANFGGQITSPSGEHQTSVTAYFSGMTKSGTGTVDTATTVYIEPPTIGAKNYALLTSGNVNMGSLPTSNAGLVTGDLWVNSGALMVA